MLSFSILSNILLLPKSLFDVSDCMQANPRVILPSEDDGHQPVRRPLSSTALQPACCSAGSAGWGWLGHGTVNRSVKGSEIVFAKWCLATSVTICIVN